MREQRRMDRSAPIRNSPVGVYSSVRADELFGRHSVRRPLKKTSTVEAVKRRRRACELGRRANYCTLIVPVIWGWIEQWYGKEPAD